MSHAGRATAVGADSVLQPRESLAWQDVAGELVVLDLDGMILRGLNRSGARAWTLLDGTRTLRDIAALLAARYRISPEVALTDLVAFAGDLLARGLLEHAPERA